MIINKILSFFNKINAITNNPKFTNLIITLSFILVNLVLLSSGLFKIFGGQYADDFFKTINLSEYRIRIGIIEIIGLVLLWFNKTSKYGLIIIWSLMIGAFTIHLTFLKESIYSPLFFGIIVWLLYSIRKYGKDIKSWF